MRKFCLPVAVVLGLVLCAVAVAAPPFEKVVPADALAFVMVKDFPALSERFKGYSAYALWKEPSVQRFLERPLERLNQEIQKAEGKAGVTLDEITGLFQGQMALFVTGTTSDDVGGVALLDVGDKGEEATRIVAALVAAAAREKENVTIQTAEEEFEGARIAKVFKQGKQKPSFVYALAGDVLLMSGKVEPVKQTISALRNPLPRSIETLQAYNDALNRVSRDSDVVVFVNLTKIMDNVRRSDTTGQKAGTITALGADGLISASMGITVGRYQSLSRLFLHIAGPPRGVVKMIIPQPGPLHSASGVPADAAGFVATRFEFAKAYDELEKILQALNPMTLQQMQMQTQQIAQTIGEPFDLRDDILAVFGPRVSFYNRFTEVENFAKSQQVVFVVEISSKAAFDAALGKMRKAVPMLFMMMQPQEYLGHQVYVFTPPQPPNAPPPPQDTPRPGFVATNNTFIISNSADALKAHLRSMGGGAPSLLDNSGFRKGLRALPVDRRVMVSFSNPVPQAKVFLNALRQGDFADKLGMLQNKPETVEIVNLFDFTLLPPNEDVIKHLVSGAGCAVVTPDGLLVISRSPAQPE